MSDEKIDPEEVELPDLPDMDESPTSESTQEAQSDLQEQLAAAQKDLLYLRAEFDNFRKQSIKERSDLLKFAGEGMARDFLGVLDIFEKALSMEVTPENLTAFTDGVKLTEKEVRDVFAKHGIEEIDCKHKVFDPTKAEALSQIPTNEVEEGHVYDVMRKGYSFHGKVLRHAQVVLATKPAQEN